MNALTWWRRMINARFRIELPETVWIAEVSDEFPRATFRLLGIPDRRHRPELGEVTAERPADVVEAIRSHPSIDDCDRLQSEDGRALTKYETSDTDLYEFVELSSLTIEFPVDVRNGWFEFDLTGTREELDRLQEVLDSASLSYELLSLVGSAESEGP